MLPAFEFLYLSPVSAAADYLHVQIIIALAKLFECFARLKSATAAPANMVAPE